MQQRQAVVAEMASRYQRSRKKEKSMILSELVELTDYSRAYARRVLRQQGRQKLGKQSLVVDKGRAQGGRVHRFMTSR